MAEAVSNIESTGVNINLLLTIIIILGNYYDYMDYLKIKWYNIIEVNNMKKIRISILLCVCLLFLVGCTDKKTELQKKYDDISYQVVQDQKQINDLQAKMDLDDAARADADRSGATSDSEYGKVLAQQDDKTYSEALQQMSQLQTKLEIDQALQKTYEEELNKMK